MSKMIALKKWHLIALGIIVLVSLAYKAYQTWHWPKAQIKINDKIITVLVADTSRHWHEGWSNKKDMGRYGGMLFIFNDYGRHPMVMRDMQFPLDMVWLSDGMVVDMAPNIPLEPGKPDNLLNLYLSSHSSNRVIELPSGTIAQTGLKIGDKIEEVRK